MLVNVTNLTIALLIYHIKTLTVLYLCQVREDPGPVDIHEMSGPRIAEAYRRDIAHSMFNAMTGKCRCGHCLEKKNKETKEKY